MPREFWNYQEEVAFSKDKANKVLLGETDHSRSTLWCLLPGQHIHPHVHAGDHIWVVLEGEGEFLQADKAPLPISPGMVLLAPSGESHGVNNNGGSGLVFISISAG